MVDINLNYYRYFFEVARLNSYTKAAEKLMISQPALSYSIKALENQLGIKLFNYNKKKLSLTKDGKAIYDNLVSVFNILDEIKVNVQNDSLKGIIKIGVKSAYASKILPGYINDFNFLYKDIEVQIYIRHNDELLELLKNDTVDLIIDDNHILYENIKSEVVANKGKSALICHKNCYDRIQNSFDNDSYDKKLYIVSSNNFSQQFYQMYNSFDYGFITNTLLLIDKLKKEECVALTAESLVKKELISGEFKVIETSLELPKIELYALYKNTPNKITRQFIDFIKDKSNVFNGEGDY